MDILIPDIGDFRDVPVIEVHVAAGDVVAAEDPLITLESDKATMDIPAPAAGTVTAVRVTVGDRVSAGHLIVNLATGAEPEPATPAAPAVGATRAPAPRPQPGTGRATTPPTCSFSAPDRAGTPLPSGPQTWARRS